MQGHQNKPMAAGGGKEGIANNLGPGYARCERFPVTHRQWTRKGTRAEQGGKWMFI